jgi:hypothetical protein
MRQGAPGADGRMFVSQASFFGNSSRVGQSRRGFVAALALGIAAFGAAGAASTAGADIVTQWNFNGSVGTTSPSLGAGTASLFGGTTATFASGNSNGGSTDPETSSDDKGWNLTAFAPQGTEDGLRGASFAVSTVGYQSIVVTWDHRHSNTSSKYVRFEYSIDGSSFSSAGLANGGIFSAELGGDTWYNNRSVDLTGIAGVANNASFAFRVVAIFDPSLGNAFAASTSTSTYAGTGTWRFDMVTVNGVVPAPGVAALLGVAGALQGRRRRSR